MPSHSESSEENLVRERLPPTSGKGGHGWVAWRVPAGILRVSFRVGQSSVGGQRKQKLEASHETSSDLRESQNQQRTEARDAVSGSELEDGSGLETTWEHLQALSSAPNIKVHFSQRDLGLSRHVQIVVRLAFAETGSAADHSH